MSAAADASSEALGAGRLEARAATVHATCRPTICCEIRSQIPQLVVHQKSKQQQNRIGILDCSENQDLISIRQSCASRFVARRGLVRTTSGGGGARGASGQRVPIACTAGARDVLRLVVEHLVQQLDRVQVLEVAVE